MSVLDKDDVITAADQAGNSTQIQLKEKGRKKKLKAEVQSLAYNNQPVDISKTTLKFSWDLDKQGQLKALEQRVKSKKDFNIDAVFKSNSTQLSGKDQGGKIKQTLNGLVLLKVFTNAGDFNWGY